MRRSPIIVYEPARKVDPDEPYFLGWFCVPIAVALFAGTMHLMWLEAAAVAKYPLAAPFHTLVIGVIWLSVNGVMLWGLWRVVKIIWKILFGIALLASDLAWAISSRCRSVRDTLVRTWRSRR